MLCLIPTQMCEETSINCWGKVVQNGLDQSEAFLFMYV